MRDKKKLIKKLVLALLALQLLSSCAKMKKWVKKTVGWSIRTVHFKNDTPLLSQQAELGVQQGVAEFNRGEYTKARKTLENFLEEHPASKYSQVAHFYIAWTYEAEDLWERALWKYRQVYTNDVTRATLKARALYRSSFAYEALGQNIKAVAILHDVELRRQFLPTEVREAEVPARLAAAYARLGQRLEAKRYYAIAEKGIQRLRQRESAELYQEESSMRGPQKNKQKNNKWLAKTYYYMGTMSLRPVEASIMKENRGLVPDQLAKKKTDEFKAALQPLKKAQVYLLQSMDEMEESWSPRALEQLKKIYSHFWGRIQEVPEKMFLAAEMAGATDVVLVARKIQKRQWQMAEWLLEAVDEIQLYQLPKDSLKSQNEYQGQLIQFVRWQKNQLERLLNETPVEQRLTPEAQRRQDKWRRGRPIMPGGQRKPSPAINSTVNPSEDPNL